MEPQAIQIATEADPASSARQIRLAMNRLGREAKEALGHASTLQERRDRFNRFFFSEAGFKPDGNQNSVDGLLLHDVLRRRQGTCVGLAQVYLILAERPLCANMLETPTSSSLV
jgi:regulator of sirC expression with transglutaminase-like and TPR domain